VGNATGGRRPARRLEAVLVVAALLAALVSLAVGPARIPVSDVLAALGGGGDALTRVIVWQIRAPRALLALLIGAMLGLSGASLQGLLRNPLADPGVVGTSGCAALGAVIALYFGLAKAFPLALPLLAVAGALVGLAALLPIARRGEGPASLILGGVAVSAMAGAGVALALNLSPNPFAVSEIAFWLLGSLTDRSFQHLALAAPLISLGAALVLSQARALDGLALGEDTARSLGFDLHRVQLLLVCGVAVGVGASVAVAGAIGFIGLVAPHLVRPFVGHQPSRTMLPSALLGATLLLWADIGTRVIHTNTELRLGVITSLIGAPFFFWLLVRLRRLAP